MNKILNKKNKTLQKLISIIIKKLITIDDNNLITITYVETNKDFSKSIIYISSLKKEKEIIQILNLHTKKIKHEVTQKIKNYKIPEIEFKLDKTYEYELMLTNIIKKNDEK